MGWTWVANTPQAPFKDMYTCFERRRADLEQAAPDGGVASGGGWHLIGDPAETILNDLEAGPLVVGAASGNRFTVPSGGFAYNLGDVAVIRFLQPGEAFITAAGSSAQPNYHWYFFQQDQNVCTEEWIHPCVPGEALDFSCGGGPTTFRADNATTTWGQNVYVVGDAAALGGWDARKALPLAARAYPSWSGTVDLPAGQTVAFKLIKIDGGGNVTWEAGGNRTLTVPASFAGAWR
jgi:hypothetical protein